MLLLIVLAYCGEDYYRILGVPRNAPSDVIRKAFKKLSLKYHPDKNKQNSEAAKKMFIKVANAYEVLSDPEKKKIYDTYGEEGVNEQTARENAGHQGGYRFNTGGNFDDVFRDFFAGGRGGQRMHQEEEDVDKDYFPQSDVITLKMNNLSRLYSRQQIWFILFFKANDQEFKDLQVMWKALAEKSYGIFKIAAVNCKSDEEICEEFDIRQTPLIVYFPETSDSEEVYRGIKKADNIFTFGVKHMQSFVRVINSDNYGDFITENPSQHKVVLFTARKTTSPLLKALSKHFKGKLAFGEIRNTESELVQKFNVSKFPSVMVLTEPEGYKGTAYDGTLNRDSLEKFLNQYSYQSIKLEKPATVRELTSDIYNKQKTCSDSDGKNICLIYLFNGDHLSGAENILLEDIANRYKNDPIKVFFINPHKYTHFWVSLDSNDKDSQFLVIKGKRRRYASLNKSDVTDAQSVNNFVDNIISGGGSFKLLKKKLNLNLMDRKEDL